MKDLADDIATLLDHFRIQRAHAVIGVSQGGAAVLNFALRYPTRTTRIIACDTQAKAPKMDIVPWSQIERAKNEGVAAIAYEMAAQWFPPESPFHPSSGSAKSKAILEMISTTPVLGFEAGAQSLRDYDLFADGLLQSNMKTLLVVGEKDAVLFEGVKSLAEEWAKNGDVGFAEISGVGHIPILDGAERWLDTVVRFLEE
jgi:pimeloyl-ACP methyl ester carboxylesterase